MSKIIREVDDFKDIKIAVHSTLNEFINKYDLIGWVRNNYNNNDRNSTIILEENNSLKLEIQKLQEQIDNINNEKTNNKQSYYFLLETLKASNFDYYNNTKINALYFFLINYNNIILKYWYPMDDLACPIFFFLEKFDLIKKEECTGPKYFVNSFDSIRFNLTQYGIDFYNYIKKEHSYILQYCNQASTEYYGNKVFYNT